MVRGANPLISIARLLQGADAFRPFLPLVSGLAIADGLLHAVVGLQRVADGPAAGVLFGVGFGEIVAGVLVTRRSSNVLPVALVLANAILLCLSTTLRFVAVPLYSSGLALSPVELIAKANEGGVLLVILGPVAWATIARRRRLHTVLTRRYAQPRPAARLGVIPTHSGVLRRTSLVIATAFAATALGPVPSALLDFIGGEASRYRTDAAHADSMPTPFPNCTPFGGMVPAGQANPSSEPEPMGPVWCFPMNNPPTTRVSGANDWVDTFNTNRMMDHLNDHEMGYRVVDAFNTNPTFMKSGRFVQNNHWMIDIGNVTQYRLSGGVMLSPDRSFHAENGKLVVEFDVAASTDGMGGANQFPEFDLTSAPDITNATVDGLYGYGEFGGVGAVGCRLESGANFVCAMYDNTFHATDGRDVRGGFPEGESGRVWETQGVGNALTGATIVGGIPEYQIPGTNLRLRDVWRSCNPNQMDVFCRDRFRFEFTKTSIHIYVNGYQAMLIDNLAASNPEGRDARIPDSFLTNSRVWFTSWINGGVTQPLTRFHWGRIAVNPHGPGGAIMPPSAAPSFCLGQPQNTCPMDTGGMPTMTPMPSGTSMATMTPMTMATNTPVPSMPSATPTRTPTRTPTPAGAGGGSSVGTYTCTEVVGFSQTMQWYFGGPESPSFTSIAGPGRWQLRWQGGAAIDSWADPNFSGWGAAAQVNSCDQGSSSPDRVLLNITGPDYINDVNWWVGQISAAIANIRSKYPNQKQIILQPVVGGPNDTLCSFGGATVRASYNNPYIEQAIARLVGGGVVAGIDAEVRGCGDYADSLGHLTDDAKGPMGVTIGEYYAQVGANDPVPTRTSTPVSSNPTATSTRVPNTATSVPATSTRVPVAATRTATSVPPTATWTPVPVPPASGPMTVTFNDLTIRNKPLNGDYPNGVINWGSNRWYLSAPWGAFTTNSIGFNGPGPTSASFSFSSPKRLLSIQAYNGAKTGSSIITLTCDGRNAKIVTLANGQLATIETGWTSRCTTIMVGSTNGWDTNFDNLVLSDG